jgi:hypothetical protein
VARRRLCDDWRDAADAVSALFAFEFAASSF